MRLITFLFIVIFVCTKQASANDTEAPIKFGRFYDAALITLSQQDSSEITSVIQTLSEHYDVVNMQTRSQKKYMELVTMLSSHSVENRLTNYQDYVTANMLLLKALVENEEYARAEKLSIELLGFFREHHSVFKDNIHRFQFALMAIYRLQGLEKKAHTLCDELLVSELPEISSDAEKLFYKLPRYKKRVGITKPQDTVVVEFTINKCGVIESAVIGKETKARSSFKKESLRILKSFFYVPLLENGKLVPYEAYKISIAHGKPINLMNRK